MLVAKTYYRLLLMVLLLSNTVSVFASGKIVLVMDDLGNQKRSGLEAISIPWVTTVAIMPGRPFTQELAYYAHELDKEIIIHAPMSNTTDFPLGSMGLDKADGKENILLNLQRSIESVPYAVGLSNHMGSRLTQDHEAMSWIILALKRKNFYFFDSRTVSTTVAWSVAEEYGVPWSMRNIFLDHYQTSEFIDSQWQKAMARARRGETVTVICHPYVETLSFLKSLTLTAEAKNYLVPLSRVLNYSVFADHPLRNLPEGA